MKFAVTSKLAMLETWEVGYLSVERLERQTEKVTYIHQHSLQVESSVSMTLCCKEFFKPAKLLKTNILSAIVLPGGGPAIFSQHRCCGPTRICKLDTILQQQTRTEITVLQHGLTKMHRSNVITGDSKNCGQHELDDAKDGKGSSNCLLKKQWGHPEAQEIQSDACIRHRR